MTNKAELQEEFSKLLAKQEDQIASFTESMDTKNKALEQLLDEIARNSNTPPEIFESAKNLVDALEASSSISEEVLQVSNQIGKVREALFALD